MARFFLFFRPALKESVIGVLDGPQSTPSDDPHAHEPPNHTTRIKDRFFRWFDSGDIYTLGLAEKMVEVMTVNMHRLGESFVEKVIDVRRRVTVDGQEKQRVRARNGK